MITLICRATNIWISLVRLGCNADFVYVKLARLGFLQRVIDRVCCFYFFSRINIKRGCLSKASSFYVIAKLNVAYTATLKSLSASFSDVLRSVEALRVPMISAHGTWYSPA